MVGGLLFVAVGLLLRVPQNRPAPGGGSRTAPAAARRPAARRDSPPRRPHSDRIKQATFRRFRFRAYPPPRSTEVVTAAYQFAAEHPEIAELCARVSAAASMAAIGQRRLLREVARGQRRRDRVGGTRPGMRRLHRRRDAVPPDALIGRLSCGTSAPPSTRSSARSRRARCRRRNPASPRRALTSRVNNVDTRAAAFARLFEAVHEGVYIGTLGPESTCNHRGQPAAQTDFRLSAARRAEAELRPFDRDRFIDPLARAALLERLETDGAVASYLLRLRRVDKTASLG